MRKSQAILLLLLICSGLAAQQEPQFNLYMFNRVALNPAAAGTDRMINVIGFGRDQWIGYKNTDDVAVNPLTFGLSFDMPVYRISSGAGLTCQYNKTGAETNLDVKIHYAYHLSIQKKHLISAGLSLDLLSKSIDYSKVEPFEDDPVLPDTKESGFMTDFDLGIQYKAYDRFNLGVSVTNLLGSSAEIGTPEFTRARHFYLYSGYDLTLVDDRNQSIMLTPGILVRTTTGALNVDLNAILSYNDFFWGGVMYRVNSAAGIMAGISFQGLKAGISYDYTMKSDFASGSRHSVEFFVRYSYAIHPPVVKKSGYNTRNM